MKGLIAVPTFETVMPETFKSIYDLNSSTRIDHDFEFVKGYDCARARNEIVKKTLEGGYDYVLMVDSDMVVPPNTLELILEWPVGVCLGLYPQKNTSTGNVEIFKLGQKNFVDRYTYETLPDEPRIEIKGGGFGCAFITAEVLRRLQYPHFKYVVYDKEGSFLSEDLYFCTRVSAIGLPIFADTRIRCGHAVKGFQYT